MFNEDFRYGAASRCTDRALVLEPHFMNARYRRGLARKGNLKLAWAAMGNFRPVPVTRMGKLVIFPTPMPAISSPDEETGCDDSASSIVAAVLLYFKPADR
jgi:hypothetical protein